MEFPFLGCPPNHLSFPMVTPDAAAPIPPRTEPERESRAHVTCLDCGREFWYDWNAMRRLAPRPQPVYAPRRVA